MHFGNRAAVSGKGVVVADLHVSNSYALRLKGISVGKERLAMATRSNSSSSSKTLVFNEQIIVDSGTILSYLPQKLCTPLEEAIKKEMDFEHANPKERMRLCYKTPDGKIRGPIITLHIVGVTRFGIFEPESDIRLYPFNTFLKVSENVHCLAFVPGYGLAILGNLAQVNFLVGFDLKRKTVSFKQTDCSKL